MQQQVVAYTIPVTREGQMEYFQIRMPHDTARIIGLEYGMLPDEGQISIPPGNTIDPHFEMRTNEQFGRLTLQVPGCGGIFYQGELTKDKNIHLGEAVGFRNWQPGLWTHGRKRTEVELSLPGADFVEGLFCNMHEDDDLWYVHIYLWIERTAS
jgi:hypothetical protein